MATRQRQELLTQVLDELIPPSLDGRVPGAGQLGVGTSIMNGSPAARPGDEEAVEAVLSFLERESESFGELDSDEKTNALQSVEARFPEQFAQLVRLTYMDYYSRPDIRPLFGVGRHPVHPDGYPVEAESPEFMEELVAPVRARGPCYRNAKS